MWILYRDERYFRSSAYINCIKTPYKTGDIVNVDCRPFGPIFNAMILEDEYQYESFPTILYKIPYTEKWNIASLKNGMFFKDMECGMFWSPLSAVFRLRLVKDEKLLEFGKKVVANPKMEEEILRKRR